MSFALSSIARETRVDRARVRRRRARRATRATRAASASGDDERARGTLDRARSFTGSSVYVDPYDPGRGQKGMPTAREIATNVRTLSGPMSGAARRAKRAMRPTSNDRPKNRADDVIERRRRVERGMREELVVSEVKNLVKERVGLDFRKRDAIRAIDG